MDTVIYSKKGEPQNEPNENYFNALKLEKLPSLELARVRAALYCSTCFEKAAYVSRGIDGRAPHCRSVHKLVEGKECPQKSAESTKVTTRGYNSVQALKNDDNIYNIDFNFGDKEDSNVHAIKPDDSTPGRKRKGGYKKFGQKSGAGKSEWSRRLSTLLKTLIDDPEFAKSDAKIKVLDKPPYPINKLFFFTDNFARYMDRLTPGQYPAFFWGSVWTAQKGGMGDIWLNTGEDSTDLSVKIPKNTAEKIRKKLALSEEEFLEGLSGGWFLLYGWYNRSKQTGKPTLALLEDIPEFITLRLGQKI